MEDKEQMLLKYEKELMSFDDFKAIQDGELKADLLRQWIKNISIKTIRATWNMNTATYYKIIDQLGIEKRHREPNKMIHTQRERKPRQKKEKEQGIPYVDPEALDNKQENKRIIIDADFTVEDEIASAFKESAATVEDKPPVNYHKPESIPSKEPLLTYTVEDEAENFHKRLATIASLIEMGKVGKVKVNIQVYNL